MAGLLSRSAGVGLLGLSLALTSACRDKPPPPAGVDAGRAAPRAGVKVPLPTGWTAQLAGDGSFQAGPPGRAVLRVDLRPGAGAALPSAEQLAAEIPKRFGAFAVSLDQEEGDSQRTLVRVTLAPKLSDGGIGPAVPAMYGAKRLGNDLFLCATLPGATPEEVRLATEACRELEAQKR